MTYTHFEKSCGAVVFSRSGGTVQYLLVRSRKGKWGFPKGHVEGTETEHETAHREIREETGLEVAFIDGFRSSEAHPLIREGRPSTLKTVIYFLAEYAGQQPAPQDDEIASTALMDVDAALAVLPFDAQKRILTEAHAFLMALISN